jgi:hypothetical protein
LHRFMELLLGRIFRRYHMRVCINCDLICLFHVLSSWFLLWFLFMPVVPLCSRLSIRRLGGRPDRVPRPTST